jgi:hypothetical protein
MKRILLGALICFAAVVSQAQTLDEIKIMVTLNQIPKAKDAIDKYLAAPKTAKNNEGQYYKGRIYAAVARENGMITADVNTNFTTAFDAFKAYQAADAKEELIKEEAYASYMDIFGGFYNNGIKAFNDKNFPVSFIGFEKALMVSDYIKSKGYNFTGYNFGAFDTSLIINTANAAMQAKDTASGLKYYGKIISAGIGGPDYESVYEACAQIYAQKKDKANYDAVAAKGRAVYPNSKFWDSMEIDMASASGNKDEMFAKYEAAFQRDPKNFNSNYNYAIELYNNIYKDNEDKPLDTVKAEKITSVLTGLLSVDTTNSTNSLLGNHLYAYAAYYSSKAAAIKIPTNPKFVKPADVKAKKALEQKSFAKMDEFIKVGEKNITYYGSLPTLKNKEKVTYRQFAEFLAEVYQIRGNAKRAAEMQKIKDSVKFN